MRQRYTPPTGSVRDDPIFQQQVAQFGYSPTFQTPEDADIAQSELNAMWNTWAKERQANIDWLQAERANGAGSISDPISLSYVATEDAMLARIKSAASLHDWQLVSE